MAAVGIWAYLQLKIEAYPDVADVEVVVISQYPGKAAEEVEKQVTIPLERALNSIPHLLTRRSKTIFGLSVIRLTFDEKVDDYFARQQVNEKLHDADLPDGVNPQLGPLTTPVGEIYRYVLDAPDSISLMELRTLQDWTLVPKLLQVSGVADVVTFGGLVKQYHILVNPQRLQAYGLTLPQFMDIVRNNNINTGGNMLERGPQAIAIRGIGNITSKEDIENIVLLAQKGVPVFLKNVATVDVGYMPPSGVLGYTVPDSQINKAQAVQGLICMRRGENPSEVLEKLQKTIDKINESLPYKAHIRVINDRRTLVSNTLNTVGHTLGEGVLIVLFVLLFFLGSVRTAIITAITIPLSLLFAFILMYLSGIPANLLSLGAIDFGIIVDGSVIMAENIIRRLAQPSSGDAQHTPLWIVKDAAKEVERQIFFSVSIIVLAFIPLFTLQRVEGKLFSPMAFTLSFAILGSMILALTAVPVLLAIFLKGNIKEWENPIAKYFRIQYEKFLPFILEQRWIVISIAGALVIASIVLTTQIGTEFLPNLDEGSVNIRTVLSTGINLKEATLIANGIRKILKEQPEVTSAVTQVGRNEDGTDPYGPNRIETFVGLKPYKEWKNGETKDEFLEKIQKRFDKEFPGASFSFSQPILDNVSEAVTGSVADLAVIVTGSDLDTLRMISNEILAQTGTTKGASEYGIEQDGPQSQLIIKVRRESAAQYGINISDIQTLVETALGGKAITSIFEGEKKIDVVVRYPLEFRSNIEEIGSLILTSAAGDKVPLQNLAEIYITDGASLIARQDGQRQISVRTDIAGRDQGSFVAELQGKVIKNVKLPHDYSISWGGQFENLTRAGKRLLTVVPITILIIFALLFMLYKKVKYALITLINVLFAFIGGITALMIRGMNFNVSAGVGFISLFGVAVMSGVLLISRINQLRFEKGYGLKIAVYEGARLQLRPILMMMVVAIIGLLPAASAHGIGSDVQRPLATVIVGGLTSALLMTLFVLPAIYYAIELNAIIKPAEEDVL